MGLAGDPPGERLRPGIRRTGLDLPGGSPGAGPTRSAPHERPCAGQLGREGGHGAVHGFIEKALRHVDVPPGLRALAQRHFGTAWPIAFVPFVWFELFVTGGVVVGLVGIVVIAGGAFTCTRTTRSCTTTGPPPTPTGTTPTQPTPTTTPVPGVTNEPNATGQAT